MVSASAFHRGPGGGTGVAPDDRDGGRDRPDRGGGAARRRRVGTDRRSAPDLTAPRYVRRMRPNWPSVGSAQQNHGSLSLGTAPWCDGGPRPNAPTGTVMTPLATPCARLLIR